MYLTGNKIKHAHCPCLLLYATTKISLLMIFTLIFLSQDSQDPLANSLLQPQFPGTLVLELDWLPSRTDKNDPLVLCVAGADSSFRLIEINV